VLLKENLEEEDIFLGDGSNINLFSVDVTKDGVEVDLVENHSFVDLWGDDVLLEEDLDKEMVTVGNISDVSVMS